MTSSRALNGTRAAAVASVVAEVIAATREVEDGQYNTSHMRKAAEAVVDLRATFIDREGRPDMGGNSFAYREALREAVAEAGVPASERTKLMTTIRYHIGNVMRDRYTAEQLESWGLGNLSPLERQRADRKSRSVAWRVSSDPELRVTEPGEIMSAARSAAALLDNIDHGALDAKTRKAFTAIMARIVERATALQRK